MSKSEQPTLVNRFVCPFARPSYAELVREYKQSGESSDIALVGSASTTTRADEGEEEANLEPIKAHKTILAAASLHLQAAFDSHDTFTDSSVETYVIQTINHDILKLIVEFVYTNQLCIPFAESDKFVDAKLRSMLIAADYLMMPELISFCGNCLAQESLDAPTCIELFLFARKYHCESLLQHAAACFLRCAAEVEKQLEFLQLSMDDVVGLVQASVAVGWWPCRINELCRAAISWLEFKPTVRRAHSRDVLHEIPLTKMDAATLRDVANKNTCLTADVLAKVREILEMRQEYEYMKEHLKIMVEQQVPRSRPSAFEVDLANWRDQPRKDCVQNYLHKTGDFPSIIRSCRCKQNSSSGPNAAYPAGTSSQQSGTAVARYQPLPGTEWIIINGFQATSQTNLHVITTMDAYKDKSLEELRAEDYSVNRKGARSSNVFSSPSSAGRNTGAFEAGASQTTSVFRQTFGGFQTLSGQPSPGGSSRSETNVTKFVLPNVYFPGLTPPSPFSYFDRGNVPTTPLPLVGLFGQRLPVVSSTVAGTNLFDMPATTSAATAFNSLFGQQQNKPVMQFHSFGTVMTTDASTQPAFSFNFGAQQSAQQQQPTLFGGANNTNTGSLFGGFAT